MRNFITADTVENENKNALRNPMKMLNALKHGSTLVEDMISLKKSFIAMLLHKLYPRNGHLNGTKYIVKHDEQRLIPANRDWNMQGGQTDSNVNHLWTWRRPISCTNLQGSVVSGFHVFCNSNRQSRRRVFCREPQK